MYVDEGDDVLHSFHDLPSGIHRVRHTKNAHIQYVDTPVQAGRMGASRGKKPLLCDHGIGDPSGLKCVCDTRA